MKRRSLFLALVCTLVVTNVAVVFGMQSVDKSSTDYPGNIKGYVSAMVVESGWFTHRGRSYECLQEVMLNVYQKLMLQHHLLEV